MPSGGASVPVVQFRDVTKRFGEVVAARDLDFEVRAGEFLSFLGPSGCGKTTTLRMIAGFEQPSAGEVHLEGRVVNGVPAYRRPVNMVFQHYALFPHLDVAGNVAYGLLQRTPRPPRAEVRRRVAETLELVRLGGFEKRRSWEMSGGQQQRVALARALINEPKVLLLDEPLAALDRKLRRDMQIELQNLQRRLGITFVLVTHDQEEALSMSDRVVIMREGRIVQIGSPRALYDRPADRYVADFVGKSNFFEGRVERVADDSLEIRLASGALLAAACPAPAPAAGAAVSLAVRPEQMILARAAEGLPPDAALTVGARVLNRIFLGEHTEYLLASETLGEFLALVPRQSELNERPFETGESLQAAWSRAAALVLEER
ncbi:spermidine/putrescine transport system ATP-binding protein [Tistlia consotensis]|uniref:Spermidine/putrescine transport system ATP-binding protein n=1 Tax=Tistlia consotensis USBA 355 TaxID=560819 RepID=A0A1Y6C8L1_9PROT|nr:ABC transporter ATP-binding protein [Tistlia consotensis]SMF51597.1 spermidine/putrescine transport system ATP-binding protein [Tistlia consotensis USBA 355]SNR83951.1 spermidine/putrescine transport system ATP-binding protein [Tistlia consotensis]